MTRREGLRIFRQKPAEENFRLGHPAALKQGHCLAV